MVVHAEGALEERAAGDHAGGDVEDEVDQNDEATGSV